MAWVKSKSDLHSYVIKAIPSGRTYVFFKDQWTQVDDEQDLNFFKIKGFEIKENLGEKVVKTVKKRGRPKKE